MLKIKTRHIFSPFQPLSSRHKLELSPVPSENDELIQAIEASATGEVWTLNAAPDTEGLHRFWRSVEDDIADDPEWIRFAE